MPADGVQLAGVIAAGRGDRLRHGTHPLKPLVRVAGQTLIERVLSSLAETGPSEVVVIVNEASLAVKDHVTSRRWPFQLRWIVESTPSSMHSFLRVVETLAAGDRTGSFLISTVDTIAAPGAFATFAAAGRDLDADVTLAVAPPGDDEKPLLVTLGSDGSRIETMGETVSRVRTQGDSDRSVWATAGYYVVRASVLREADEARRDGVCALRAFFERLLARGYRLHAIPVAGGIDVDRPADVRAAESFLRQVGA